MRRSFHHRFVIFLNNVEIAYYKDFDVAVFESCRIAESFKITPVFIVDSQNNRKFIVSFDEQHKPFVVC